MPRKLLLRKRRFRFRKRCLWQVQAREREPGEQSEQGFSKEFHALGDLLREAAGVWVVGTNKEILSRLVVFVLLHASLSTQLFTGAEALCRRGSRGRLQKQRDQVPQAANGKSRALPRKPCAVLKGLWSRLLLLML